MLTLLFSIAVAGFFNDAAAPTDPSRCWPPAIPCPTPPKVHFAFVDANVAPFAFTDPETHEPSGGLNDVVSDALDSLGFVEDALPRMHKAPKTIMTSLTAGEPWVWVATRRLRELDDVVEWVGPLHTTQLQVIARQGHPREIRGRADLRRVPLAIVLGNGALERLLAHDVPRDNISAYVDLGAAIEDLALGRIPYLVHDLDDTRFVMRERDYDTRRFAAAYVVDETPLYIAIAKSIAKPERELLTGALRDTCSDPVRMGLYLNPYTRGRKAVTKRRRAPLPPIDPTIYVWVRHPVTLEGRWQPR